MKNIQDDQKNKDIKISVILKLIVEIFFIMIPIVVVLLLGRGVNELFKSGELMVISIVLWGQPIIKIFYAGCNNAKCFNVDKTVLAITSMLLLGLVPSCIILTRVIDNPDDMCVLVQIILFLLSIVCFLLFGAISEFKIRCAAITCP